MQLGLSPWRACSAPLAVAGTMSLTGQEKFETAPTDKRFPTTNQAKHCYMFAPRALTSVACTSYCVLSNRQVL